MTSMTEEHAPDIELLPNKIVIEGRMTIQPTGHGGDDIIFETPAEPVYLDEHLRQRLASHLSRDLDACVGLWKVAFEYLGEGERYDPEYGVEEKKPTMNEIEDARFPYTDTELVERAVHTAISRGASVDSAAWISVKHAFGTGQTVSRDICKRFGFDPDSIREERL